MPTLSTCKPRISATAKHRARRAAWTPARRARQAALIRRWQPWTKSTGPRTDAGLARSRAKACKSPHAPALKELNRLLALQGRYLRALRAARRTAAALNCPAALAVLMRHFHDTVLRPSIDPPPGSLYHPVRRKS